VASSAPPSSKRFRFRSRRRAGRGRHAASRGAAALRGLLGAWIRRRQGEDGAATVLERRRIYILPTRYGIAFGCLLFAMLLGSLNYGASLAFALTFLLTGLGLVMLYHCHENLLGVEVAFAGAPPVFAGEDAQFRIRLSHSHRAPRYEVELRADRRDFGPVDVPPNRAAVIAFTVPAPRRGRLAMPRFAVGTRHPGNLFRAWAYVHMTAGCVVYPRPAPADAAAPITVDERHGKQPMSAGDTDFAGLRTAAPGDPPRRIAWKAYARTDELLLKQFSGGAPRAELFDLNDAPGADLEEKLSLLARWCLDAAATGRSFGLRLPSTSVPLGQGERHLHRCLTALGLYPAAVAGDGAAR
jgi:uncharacterized protein (DUF58 family)